MPIHNISQDILDGFNLLGLPVNEHSYAEDPEDVIFSYTDNFKICSCITQDKEDIKTFSSVLEAMNAELGRNS